MSLLYNLAEHSQAADSAVRENIQPDVGGSGDRAQVRFRTGARHPASSLDSAGFRVQGASSGNQIFVISAPGASQRLNGTAVGIVSLVVFGFDGDAFESAVRAPSWTMIQS